MQISEAAVLVEVEGVREANERLKAGWRLLPVTVKTSPADNYQYTYFCVGQARRAAEPVAGRRRFSADGKLTRAL